VEEETVVEVVATVVMGLEEDMEGDTTQEVTIKVVVVAVGGN